MAALASARQALAADARSLDGLRYGAAVDSRGSIQAAAREFEALFMREIIKSMREATMKSGLTDGGEGDLGTELLDQQLAVQMTGMPGGLAPAIERQLAQRLGVAPPAADGAKPVAAAGAAASAPAAVPAAASTVSKGRGGAAQQQFVQEHAQAAERVARASGIPARFMLGQAGHETGWGRRPITMADGSPSNNLFGIKATAGWTGKVAEVTTTEYIDGKPRKVVSRFRAYDSPEASFEDYARLINESPRYAQARRQTGSAEAFAAGLQKAGYATDPQYAAKLSRAINAALQVQRASA